jgi:uncharacterized protein
MIKMLFQRISYLVKRHTILAGLLLMFAFTWPIDLIRSANSHGWTVVQVPEALAIFLGFGFVAASILATAIVSGRTGVIALLRRFLIWRVGMVWYGIALFLPLLLNLTGIGIQALFTGLAPNFGQVYAYQLFGSDLNLLYLVIPFLLFDAISNGEEIGWRGYILPRLQKRHSAFIASLIVGLIWGLWHWPKFLAAGNETLVWLYMVDIMAKAILYTWIFNNTRGSLLIVTLFHAAGNTAGIFLPIQAAAIPIAAVTWLAAISVIAVTGWNLSDRYKTSLETLPGATIQ